MNECTQLCGTVGHTTNTAPSDTSHRKDCTLFYSLRNHETFHYSASWGCDTVQSCTWIATFRRNHLLLSPQKMNAACDTNIEVPTVRTCSL